MSQTFSLEEIKHFHNGLIRQSGGSSGIRDLGALESALAQPLASFGGESLYPEITDRAGVLAHALIANHPFVDGNKRVGHAAMAVYLLRHGLKLLPSIDEQEEVVLRIAGGEMTRDDVRRWVATAVVSTQT